MSRRALLAGLGVLARGLLWLLCALAIYVMYDVMKGRAYEIAWSAAAATLLPLALRAVVARVRRSRERLPPPPASVYRTPAASTAPPRRRRIPILVAIDALVPLAFIACVTSLEYDPTPAPESVPMCCCAPCSVSP